MYVGAPAEFALRATSLAFFLVSTWVLWAIVRFELDGTHGSIGCGGISPGTPRLAVEPNFDDRNACGRRCPCGLLEPLRWDRGDSKTHLAAAIALAVLASMLKITTAAIWLAPAIILLQRSRLVAFGIVGASLVAGVAWTIYTDMMKSGSPAMQFLLSTNLREWTFGSISQRLDPATWLACIGWVAGIGILVVLGPFVVRRKRIGLWARRLSSSARLHSQTSFSFTTTTGWR